MLRIWTLVLFSLPLFPAFPLFAQQKKKDAEKIPCNQLNDDPGFVQSDTLPRMQGRTPETLEQCLKALDRLLNPYQKRFISCQPEAEVRETLHDGLGTWIRQTWGLWDASPLRYHFLERGVLHPDDMSGIILVSYYRKLKKEPLMIEEQIDYFQRYWRAQGVNIDSLLRSARNKN